MFDSAGLDHRVTKAAYRREEAKLRTALLNAQYDLSRDGRFAVLILIAGVQGAGKGESVHQLAEWMDPRHLLTTGFAEPSGEERERPRLWRYWNALPPRGRIGVFFGAWHTEPILARARGKMSSAELALALEEIVRLEKLLCDDGLLLLKYWFHVSKKRQRKRLEAIGEKPATPYGKFVAAAESVVRRTSTGEAPWIVVPGADSRYRALAFGRHLLASMRKRLDARARRRSAALSQVPPLARPADDVNVVRALELDQPMARRAYQRELAKWQRRLGRLSRDPRMRSTSVVAVFEGNDAAGKGSAIRRVTQALDARYYRSVPVAAPTEEERAQPWLWRFWRQLPRRGRLVLFDRSWYGRVLVERVERLVPEADWMRAYAEINDFETALARHGMVLAKFWLAVSKDEQLRRFKAREKSPFKRFKITPEDWRNREKWDEYEIAVSDMVERTSSRVAPWTLVEADNKYFARIKVLKTLCQAIEDALERVK